MKFLVNLVDMDGTYYYYPPHQLTHGVPWAQKPRNENFGAFCILQWTQEAHEDNYLCGWL